MTAKIGHSDYDFKGIGFSKIGYFKEVRSKMKELEQLNIELARRHNKLEAIINSMNCGLTILDANMNIIFVNRLQMIMFPDVSLLGDKCHWAFYRRQSICSDCPACMTFQTRDTYRGEIRLKHGALAGRYYEWSTSPVEDPFGRVQEVVLLMRDITRRKEAEFNLLQSDRMAAIGLLAAGIAHEINNPLTSIAGFSEALLKRMKNSKSKPKKNTDDDCFEEYLKIIFNEAYRCKDIIQNLIDYSLKSTESKEALPIANVIDKTVTLVRKHARNLRINIVFNNHLTPGFNKIIGNESQIKHLLLNLLNHSLKIAGQEGVIGIVVKNRGNLIEIFMDVNGTVYSEISNSEGVEMSCGEAQIPCLPEIDLSICYNIMRQHNGELKCLDNHPGGLSFVMCFPAVLD
jgi:signal transduction histidine kinase